MTPRGSRPSSGGRDGGRLLDPAAEGVDVVPQECPVGAHDQHVDDVEADQHFAVGRVNREPGSRRNLKVATLDGYPSRHDGFQEHTACRAYDRRIAHARGREVRMERSTSPYAWKGRRGTTRRSSSRSSASAPPGRSTCFSSFRVRKNDTGTIFQHERFLVMAGKGVPLRYHSGQKQKATIANIGLIWGNCSFIIDQNR